MPESMGLKLTIFLTKEYQRNIKRSSTNNLCGGKNESAS